MKLFSFQGRASRLAYLSAAVTVYAVLWPVESTMKVCASFLGQLMTPGLFFSPAIAALVRPLINSDTVAACALGASLMCLAATFLVWLSVAVRRLHDINLSGWYVLAPLLAPHMLPPGSQGAVAELVVGVAWDLAMVIVPAIDGSYRLGPVISEPARIKPVDAF